VLDSEKFHIDLGNSNDSIRKTADIDFISFWNERAKYLTWFKTWEKTLDWTPPFARWFVGGQINASYNTLDIHQVGKSSKTAIFWEGEDGSERIITYSELYILVKKFANVLKTLGVESGDRVTIYLPMVPELIISMLACARIGAIHAVVFSGFSSISVKDRVEDSESKIIITADGGFRKGKLIKLKEIVDESASKVSSVEHVIILRRANNEITLNENDKLWSDLMLDASEDCDAEKLESTHPLYILYTNRGTSWNRWISDSSIFNLPMGI
jgi:acetyl-CoA synthetase